MQFTQRHRFICKIIKIIYIFFNRKIILDITTQTKTDELILCVSTDQSPKYNTKLKMQNSMYNMVPLNVFKILLMFGEGKSNYCL